MQLPVSFSRACAALILLAACGTGSLPAAPASASTPSLLWADARRLAVNCLVQSNSLRDLAAFEKALCARVRGLAGRDAPFPVTQVQPGDAALVAADSVTLLVHASVERTPRGRTVAFTIRPYRSSEAGSGILYGTAPRLVEMASTAPNAALDAALGDALAELLPWQRPSGLVARPL